MKRPVDAVEAVQVDQGPGFGLEQVRLTELDPREDAQLGKVMPHPLDAVEVPVDVEGSEHHPPVRLDVVPLLRQQILRPGAPGARDVEVLGEEDRRKADPHRLLAGGPHAAGRGGIRASGVPGELGVHVAVGGQGHVEHARPCVRHIPQARLVRTGNGAVPERSWTTTLSPAGEDHTSPRVR